MIHWSFVTMVTELGWNLNLEILIRQNLLSRHETIQMNGFRKRQCQKSRVLFNFTWLRSPQSEADSNSGLRVSSWPCWPLCHPCWCKLTAAQSLTTRTSKTQFPMPDVAHSFSERNRLGVPEHDNWIWKQSIACPVLWTRKHLDRFMGRHFPIRFNWCKSDWCQEGNLPRKICVRVDQSS